MTDNWATRTTFVRTRPALHEAEDEAEAERPRPKILASTSFYDIPAVHLMGIVHSGSLIVRR